MAPSATSLRRDLPRTDYLQERAPPGAGWTQPIVVGRHAYGDQYRATDFRFPGKGVLTMKFVGEDGTVIEKEVFKAPDAGVAMGMYNLDESIRDFARASLNYGLTRNYPVYLSTKNTTSRPMTGVSRISSRRSSRRSSRPSSTSAASFMSTA